MSHFYDKLTKEHNIKLSYNWIRLALEGAGLVETRHRHDPHRKRRARKPLVGMMLHMDGSLPTTGLATTQNMISLPYQTMPIMSSMT